MAEFIPRDLSTPFDPNDPEQIAAFEGFACDVPSTDGMIDAVNGVAGFTRANLLRAQQLFAPGFLTGLVGGTSDMPTPDVTTPSVNAIFERRGLHDQTLNVPGGPGVLMWSFEARLNRGQDVNIEGWPAATIRVREGEIVHSIMGSRSGPHTIHHHGIEPTPANDGVGHLTFEVGGGQYIYQWQAAESGTYFYHCHRNTVLHFEMGMYGMLIIDPDVPGAPFADGGPGVTLVRDVPTPYNVEAIWVADDIDARFRGLDVAQGIQACDTDGRSGFMTINDPDNPRLHAFNPTYFVVSGQAAPAVDNGQNIITGVGATVTVGQKLLARVLNASYCTEVWKFPTTLQGTVTATDGRTLGRPGFGSYSAPYSLASINHQFTLTTAQRHDILIDATGTAPGQHLVEIEFRHWITNQLLRTVRVPINVQSA
jgi:plastocyanin